MGRRAAGTLLLVVASVAVARRARAEAANPGQGGLFAAQAAVRLEEIPSRLVELEERTTRDKDLADLEERLQATSRRLAARLADVERAKLETAIELRIAGRDVEQARKLLDGWSAMLASYIPLVERDLAEVGATRGELVRMLRRLKREQAPHDIVRRPAETLRLVRVTRGKIEAHLGRLLALQRRAARERATADELRERFEIAGQHLVVTIHHRDSPPLWDALAHVPATRDVLATVRTTLARDRAGIEEFLEDDPSFLPITALVFLLVWGTAFAFRGAARRIEQQDPGLEKATRVLDRPVSVGLLALPLVLFMARYDNTPVTLRAVFAMVTIVPAVRIVAPLLPRAEAGAAHVLAVLLLLNLVGTAFRDVPAIGRLVGVVACIVVLRFLLHGRRHDRPALLRLARDAASVLILTAIAANLGGFVHLSQYLGNGVLRILLIAVLCFTFLAVLDAFVAIAVHTRLSAAVRKHAGDIRRLAHTVGRLAVALIWLLGVLEVFVIREPVMHALDVVFGTKLAVGAMAVSLGDVLAFGVTVWLSFQLSRAVGAFLQEDVFPRMALGRGVPYAVTTVSSYTVLIVGFLFALAAAGFTLDRIAVRAAAFGVGAGFGLQTIVNNFVSGLVLLFERPIQIGDIVQLGDVVGEVRRIGLRSSVVRTFEGAEVILPNSALVGEQVTNWTLSDAGRRVAVRVGVAYGTDPEVVLSLLINVAAQQPGALTEPAPEALFLGFGESALDFELRAWVARADVVASFGSTLGIGVERALREAGITIPFPQRDLNVRTTAAPAATAPVLFARDRRG